MIFEHAILPIEPGRESEFEAAFGDAKAIVAAAPGFAGLTLSRSIENPSTYLLLVNWNSLEDHTDGFRASEGYAQWRALLHHFYGSPPTVDHQQQVASA